ncbi:MAG: aminotransferase class I/II-fold pyridoxal phosphate-dependent enzyme [SAR86 cluster bacterium]|jgi:N-succinyldiaminopimelate aminotransferase|nr:aminotransferase class I/II-fold pyridoxal phosphate-dependent enzyme [SAR86 cluster bacterium]
MNHKLDNLSEYPFFFLNELLANEKPSSKELFNLSIGEPKNAPPSEALQILKDKGSTLSQYPTMKGIDILRESFCSYLQKRFDLKKSPDPNKNVLPLSGTREGLFSFIQYVVNTKLENPTVVMPNPVYKIYEGASILAGAKPYFLNSNKENNFKPDLKSVPKEIWKDCQLLILCSPSNPTGYCMNLDEYRYALSLAKKYDFMICSDECYTDLYPSNQSAPSSAIELSEFSSDYSRIATFHSLSKRSNLAGLRSGFITSDELTIKKFLLYRTYHGVAMPLPSQYASAWAWEDENHVATNRRSYDKKFDMFLSTIDSRSSIRRPPGAFYIWLETPYSDKLFTKNLYKKHGIIVLPGSYLGVEQDKINPGKNFVRLAIVHNNKTIQIAAQAINEMLNG